MIGNVKNLTSAEAWAATLAELELQMTKATFNKWLKDAQLVTVQDGVFTIGLRNDYALDWVQSRMADTIARTLTAVLGQRIQLKYVVIDSGRQASLLTTPPAANGSKPHHTRQSGAGNHPPAGDTQGIRYRRIRPPSDPLKGHVQVSHYAIRFWREYLIAKYKHDGPKVFDLWLIISSYAYEFEVLQKDGPSIKQLMAKLGMGDRNDMVGRGAWKGKKVKHSPKLGYLNILRMENICHHYTEGRGRGAKQYFDYLTRIENAPLLTPQQVALLPKDGQAEHKEWLAIHTAVSYEEWLADPRETAIEALPLEESP